MIKTSLLLITEVARHVNKPDVCGRSLQSADTTTDSFISEQVQVYNNL